MASVAAGYLPILLFLGVALALSAAFVVLPMLVARLTGAHKPYPDKLTEYECGFPAFEDSRAQFDVRFYLVAILFIVFDLEAAFLFPWAVSADRHRLGRLDRDDDLPRRARSWASPMPGRRERSNGSDPRRRGASRCAPAGGCRSPIPTSSARSSPRSSDKGFLVTSTEDLFHWARTGSLVVDDLRPRLLRGRDDPCEHAAL